MNTSQPTFNLNTSIGDFTSGFFGDPINYPTFYPLIERYYSNYPVYTYIQQDKSKIEQSFKIVQALIDNKTINNLKTVKDFIDIVNKIVTIL